MATGYTDICCYLDSCPQTICWSSFLISLPKWKFEEISPLNWQLPRYSDLCLAGLHGPNHSYQTRRRCLALHATAPCCCHHSIWQLTNHGTTPRCRNQTSSNIRALGLYHVVAVIKTSSNCRALGLHPVTMAIQNNNTNTDVTFPRKAKTLKRNAKSRRKVTNLQIPPKNIAKTLFNKTLFFSFC